MGRSVWGGCPGASVRRGNRLLVFVSAVLAGTAAAAVSVGSDEMTQCDIAALANGPSSPLHWPPLFVAKASEPSLCAISAPTLHQRLKASVPVLVDTRSAEAFAAAHMAGALNIASPLVPHKPFLRGKHVVLVGSVHNDRSLWRLCARAGELGVASIQVLDGGVAAWVASGFPVQGTAYGGADLFALAPSAALQAFQDRPWVIVGPPAQDWQAQGLPLVAGAVPYIDDAKWVASEARRQLAGSGSTAGVLVVVNQPGVKDFTHQLAEELAGRPVRHLTGGVPALRDAVARLAAIQSRSQPGELGGRQCRG